MISSSSRAPSQTDSRATMPKQNCSESGTTWRSRPTRTRTVVTRLPLACRSAVATIALATDSSCTGLQLRDGLGDEPDGGLDRGLDLGREPDAVVLDRQPARSRSRSPCPASR